MNIVFVRHGERQAGESDPELTSFGFRMVEEVAAWMLALEFSPQLALTTPTRRTHQTVSTILAHFPDTLLEEIPESPELETDWEVCTEKLSKRNKPPDSVLMVGHHPTLEMLLQNYGPPPMVVSRHHFAVGLLLQQSESRWSIVRAWPGRRS
jgi:phosphohistidine phosphatase SixA